MVKDSGGKPASKVALVYSPLLSGSPSFSAEKSRNFSDFETNLGTAQCSHLLSLSAVKHQTPSRSPYGFLQCTAGIQMGITAAVVSVCWCCVVVGQFFLLHYSGCVLLPQYRHAYEVPFTVNTALLPQYSHAYEVPLLPRPTSCSTSLLQKNIRCTTL